MIMVIINRSTVSPSTSNDEVEEDEREVENFGHHQL